jgi:hypothetical protein
MNILAQVAAENPVLYTYGPLGVLCSYFIWRGETLAKDVKKELVDMKSTMLLDILSRESAGEKARAIAQRMLAEIEARKS